jgi:hypothetical protein
MASAEPMIYLVRVPALASWSRRTWFRGVLPVLLDRRHGRRLDVDAVGVLHVVLFWPIHACGMACPSTYLGAFRRASVRLDFGFNRAALLEPGIDVIL